MSYHAPDNLLRHPLSAVFGEMDDDQFEELAVSIEKEGQKHDVVIFEGKVLDGWNRYRACQMLGIKCNVVDHPLDLDPIPFVVRENLRRRDLTPSKRAIISAALAQIAAERLGASRSTPAPDPAPTPAPAGRPSLWGAPGKQREAAAAAGVSQRTLQRAAKALQEGRAKNIIDGKEFVSKPRAPKPPPEAPTTESARIAQLEAAIADLTSELEVTSVLPEDVESKMRGLLAENAQLRDQIGVWQEKHAEAVAKVKRLESALRKYESA